MDLVGPLGDGNVGARYILTVEDAFTRYVTAVPIPNKETQTVARALLDRVVLVYGCPERIHSDQGTEFCSNLWKELMSQLRINKTETPAYNPQSNIVERFHRVLGAMLRTLLDREDPSWVSMVPVAVFAYNTKVHGSTGMTPFGALYGREARIPLDLILENPAEKFESPQEFVRGVIRRIKTVYAYIRKNGEAVIRWNSNQYTGNVQDWKQGQLVWYCSLHSIPGKPDKLVNAWRGPYRIVEQVAEVLVDITPANTEGKSMRVHITRLKEYRGDPHKRGPPVQEIDDGGDLDGEEIAYQSAAPPEMGITVVTGGGGRETEIVDKVEAQEDLAAEPVTPVSKPIEVQDKIMADTASGTTNQETEPDPRDIEFGVVILLSLCVCRLCV